MGYILLGFIYFIPFFIIGWNAWKILSYYRRTRKFIKVPAQVVNISIKKASIGPGTGSSFGGKENFFAPIIEFTDLNGETHVLEYTEDNPDRALYSIGEEITICYNPEEPRKFLVYDPKAEYLVAAAWILVGSVIIYLMFFFNWNSKPPF